MHVTHELLGSVVLNSSKHKYSLTLMRAHVRSVCISEEVFQLNDDIGFCYSCLKLHIQLMKQQIGATSVQKKWQSLHQEAKVREGRGSTNTHFTPRLELDSHVGSLSLAVQQFLWQTFLFCFLFPKITEYFLTALFFKPTTCILHSVTDTTYGGRSLDFKM